MKLIVMRLQGHKLFISDVDGDKTSNYKQYTLSVLHICLMSFVAHFSMRKIKWSSIFHEIDRIEARGLFWI